MKIISLDHAMVEIERLRAENERLRGRLRLNTRHARRLQRAYDAALLLAVWHVGYLDLSRAACMGRGMTQRQFENGIALLRLARLINGHKWAVHDLPLIESRLRAAQDRAADVPEAFFARLPRHARK